MLTVVTHPVYRDEWCVQGPPVYPSVRAGDTIWYGPPSIWACLEARGHLAKVLEAA